MGCPSFCEASRPSIYLPYRAYAYLLTAESRGGVSVSHPCHKIRVRMLVDRSCHCSLQAVAWLMQMNKIIRTAVGPDYADERNTRGMVNGRGTPVGRDLSPPPPIYRPVAECSTSRIILLYAIIAPSADVSALGGFSASRMISLKSIGS
jgi:hypothetical protein